MAGILAPVERLASCLCLVAGLALGCGGDATGTQTVLRFSAHESLTVPAGSTLRITFFDDGARQDGAGEDFGAETFEPDIKFVVLAGDDDAGRRFSVFAELLAPGGERLSWARVRTGFIADTLAEVRVVLAPSCLAPPDRRRESDDTQAICGSHDTCVASGGGGVCAPACRAPEAYEETLRAQASPVVPCPAEDCATVDSVELGWTSSCAASAGDVYCWGRISFSEVGEGQLSRPSWVLDATGKATPGPYRAYSTAVRQTCVVDGEGGVFCGGDNSFSDGNRLGVSTDAEHQCCTLQSTPAPPPLESIRSGENATCGLTGDGTLYCTGTNSESETGEGQFTPWPLPTGLDDFLLARDFFCGLGGGVLTCAGRENPLDGPLPLANPRSMAAGVESMCIVDESGTLTCYGEDAARESYAAPQVVPGVWTMVAMPQHALSEDGHRCGIRDDGTLWCWGDNTGGALGVDGPNVDETAPVQVGTESDWTYVGVGAHHTCAVRGGELYCFGDNEADQLGVEGAGTTRRHVCLPSW